MREMKVYCARFNEQTKCIEVVREITHDDGTIEYNGLSLPDGKLEWLAAECNIDDIDELVEMAIYESFMPNRSPYTSIDSARQQSRAQLAEIKSRLGSMRPGGSRQDAKDKLRLVGMAQEYIDAIDDDGLEVIKRHSKFDRGSINTKRAYINEKLQGTRQKSNKPIRRSNGRSSATVVRLPEVKLSGGKRVK
jgi:hypothetical protein